MATVDESVFISYETETALNLARLAKMRLERNTLKGWVWQDDSRFGLWTLEEIADKIYEFEHFLYLCTEKSDGSHGQRRERNWALEFNKDPIVITFAPEYVSRILKGCNEIRTNNLDFQAACDAATVEIIQRREVKLPSPVVVPADEDLRLSLDVSETQGGSN